MSMNFFPQFHFRPHLSLQSLFVLEIAPFIQLCGSSIVVYIHAGVL